MYFVYSKTHLDNGKFWQCNNIKIYGAYDNSSDADKKLSELAYGHLQQQNESGYKIRKENDIFIISKDEYEISKGYFYNSTYIRKVDVMSFHICYASDQIISKPEIKTEKITHSNSNHMKLVIDQMREVFEKGNKLRKID
jgi:hypothetical protein